MKIKILSKLIYLWPIVLLAIVIIYFKKANDEKSVKEEKKINQDRSLRIKDSLNRLGTLNFEKGISEMFDIEARIDTIKYFYSNSFTPLLGQNLLLQFTYDNNVYVVDKYKGINGRNYIDIFIDNSVELYFNSTPYYYPIMLRLDAGDFNILTPKENYIIFKLDYVKKESQSINITNDFNGIDSIPIYFSAQGKLLKVLNKETYLP
jgi:hypothetical protein